MSVEDGGPAFPQTYTETVGERGDYRTEINSAPGMSTLDYFAGQALAGFLAGMKQLPSGFMGDEIIDEVVATSFKIAAAMLMVKKEFDN